MTESPADPRYWLHRAVERAQVGNRSETAMWLACQLRDNRTDILQAEHMMEMYAGQVPQSDVDRYTARQAVQTLRAVYRSRPPREACGGELTPEARREWQRLEHREKRMASLYLELAGMAVQAADLPDEGIAPPPFDFTHEPPLESSTCERVMRRLLRAHREQDHATVDECAHEVTERLVTLLRIAEWYYTKHPEEFRRLCDVDLSLDAEDLFERIGIDTNYLEWEKALQEAQ